MPTTATLELPTLESLDASLDAMRECGFYPSEGEVGPLTYEFLIECEVSHFRQRRSPVTEMNEWLESAHLTSEDHFRRQFQTASIPVEYREVRLYKADVPERSIWPR